MASIDASPETEDSTSVLGSFDWKSYFAGTSLLFSIAAGGVYIQNSVQDGNLILAYSALLVSYFIGSSTGHYFGKAIDEIGKSTPSAMFGFFSSAAIYWVYQNGTGVLSIAMVLMAASLILGHYTELFNESDSLRRLVEYFAEGISPSGLLLFGALKYVGPAIPISGLVSWLVQNASQKVTFFGAELNIIFFAIIATIAAVIILGIMVAMSTVEESNSN